MDSFEKHLIILRNRNTPMVAFKKSANTLAKLIDSIVDLFGKGLSRLAKAKTT